jgi:hypothetical protein
LTTKTIVFIHFLFEEFMNGYLEQIKKALTGDLTQTTQNAVSLPAIQRYIDRLNAGEQAPPIKMDSNVIVDGNHRYIAGAVQGTMPEVVAGTMAPSKTSQIQLIHSIKIDTVDWGNH